MPTCNMRLTWGQAAVLCVLLAVTACLQRYTWMHVTRDQSQAAPTATDGHAPLTPEAQAWMTRYELLHAHILSLPEAHAKRRFLIFRSPMAGLGNRFSGMVSALTLAMLTDRAFLVDWNDVQSSALLSTDHRLDWTIEPWERQWLQDANRAPKLGAELGPDLGSIMETLCIGSVPGVVNDSLGDAVPWIRVTTGQTFLPMLQASPRFGPLLHRLFPHGNAAHHLLHRYVRPIPRLQAQVEELVQRLGGPQRYIGLHMRNEAPYVRPHLPQFWQCATWLARHTRLQPGLAFYVATDDATLEPLARAHLQPWGRVLSNPHLHGPTHARVRADPQQWGSAELMEQSLVDLWVLGNAADLVVTAGSTFSYIAQALADVAPVTVNRYDKCVRPLSSEPPTPLFPMLRRLPCWSTDVDLLHPHQDQLCADAECPILCGGRYEQRVLGQNLAALEAQKQQRLKQQLGASPDAAKHRQARKAEKVKQARANRAKRPDFWKHDMPWSEVFVQYV